MVETGGYTVQKGDTLHSIAQRHGVPDWRFIWAVNYRRLGGNPDLIKPGQQLSIPDVSVVNAARTCIEFASYFNCWAAAAQFFLWLVEAAPTGKEITAELAKQGLFAAEEAKFSYVMNVLGRNSTFVKIVFGVCEFVLDNRM